MAVEVLSELRLVYPSALADDYYLQALRMLAFTEKDARVRNYYLTKVGLITGQMCIFYLPQSGDVWTIGTPRYIDLSPESVGVVASVNIQLSRDGGKTWTTIFSNVPFVTDSSGHVRKLWTVTGPATSNAVIKVVSASDSSISATSGIFTISE